MSLPIVPCLKSLSHNTTVCVENRQYNCLCRHNLRIASKDFVAFGAVFGVVVSIVDTTSGRFYYFCMLCFLASDMIVKVFIGGAFVVVPLCQYNFCSEVSMKFF
ncbi:hypothetical protein C2G38_2034714 [Gigaspora rosea]|uniref:Uncharacterized protein n=1 Tax=Gigaspora rosea TaxID=44941 RepID=A0A397VGV8_9GLOM|nr:hypothetical protein C2G38_2034714 [Gigaspora rosea]